MAVRIWSVLCLVALLATVPNGAEANIHERLAKIYAANWVLVEMPDPHSTFKADLLVVDEGPSSPSDVVNQLDKNSKSFDAVYQATLAQAAQVFNAPSKRISALIPGHLLSSPVLRPVFGAPNRVFVIKPTRGVYKFANIFGGKLSPLREYDDPIDPNERIIVHAGALLSGETSFGTVFVDPQVSIAELDGLFQAMNATYKQIAPLFQAPGRFAQEEADLDTPWPALVTTAQGYAAPDVQNALRSLPHLSVARYGRLAERIEITSEIQHLTSQDLGLRPLYLSDKNAPLALRVPRQPVGGMNIVETRVVEPPASAFADHQSETCNFVQNDTAGRSDRLAIVLGNGAYDPHKIGWLETPADDAKAAAQKFFDTGFDVALMTEASAALIRDCVKSVLADTSRVDVAIFYYSGHGIQINDQNYLVPVDAAVGPEFKSQIISFDEILLRLRKISTTTIAFLDACRDNRLPDLNSGLAALGTFSKIEGAAQNEIAVVFATSPSNVAYEYDGDANSPFTAAFLAEFGQKGISLQDTLVRISARVGEKTNWRQTPFTRSSLSEVMYLNGTQTRDDIIAISKAKAQEAENKLRGGDLKAAVRLALEAFPKGATIEDALRDFPDALRAIEVLHYMPVIPLEWGVEGNISGSIGRNWRYAFFQSHQNAAQDSPVVDIQTGKTVASIPVTKYHGGILSEIIADTPDGRLIAVPSADLGVWVLDVAAKTVQTLNIPGREGQPWGDDRVEMLEFDSTGARLLVRFAAAGAYLFDVATGQNLYALTGIELPNGAHELSDDLTIRLLDDGRLCVSIARENTERQAGFHAIGKYNPITKTAEDVLWSNEAWTSQIFECSRDGRTALLTHINAGGFGNTQFVLVDFETGQVLVRDALMNGAAALSADGTRAIFAGPEHMALFDMNKRSFIPAEHLERIGEVLISSALVVLNGRLDLRNHAEANSFMPELFQVDVPLEVLLQSAFERLTPEEFEHIDKNRVTLLPR